MSQSELISNIIQSNNIELTNTINNALKNKLDEFTKELNNITSSYVSSEIEKFYNVSYDELEKEVFSETLTKQEVIDFKQSQEYSYDPNVRTKIDKIIIESFKDSDSIPCFRIDPRVYGYNSKHYYIFSKKFSLNCNYHFDSCGGSRKNLKCFESLPLNILLIIKSFYTLDYVDGSYPHNMGFKPKYNFMDIFQLYKEKPHYFLNNNLEFENLCKQEKTNIANAKLKLQQERKKFEAETEEFCRYFKDYKSFIEEQNKLEDEKKKLQIIKFKLEQDIKKFNQDKREFQKEKDDFEKKLNSDINIESFFNSR